MLRVISLLTAALFALAACDPIGGPQLGPDGRPVQGVYRISQGDLPRVQFRALDAVNTLRARSGAQPLELNAQLNAAAATHARDMSRQQRPWHFGSDGSSPVERVRRAGYPGTMKGELVSETFETELETITAWMQDRETRSVLLDPEARDMGFNFHQDPNGKLWWVLVTGNPNERGPMPRRDGPDLVGF
ncbi:CAP domain-containing protein [Alkalilacustris brevis]|uniref:CAP domain-containing protein n=1 Tax=Alkalilacustris brevis TaxID=2026338 RepID=UPI000E0CC6A8|nr:CAP domain-containing protein [Alkalilacustris brevis]